MELRVHLKERISTTDISVEASGINEGNLFLNERFGGEKTPGGCLPVLSIFKTTADGFLCLNYFFLQFRRIFGQQDHAESSIGILEILKRPVLKVFGTLKEFRIFL